MANELHDNVKFRKQQTINFHENWQHQIDGSQQYLKGHTQTERMENKRTQLKIRIKKLEREQEQEHRVSGKIMIGYIIQQEQTTRAGSRANRIERRTIWVTCQRRTAKKYRCWCRKTEKIYIYLFMNFYQQRQYNIVKVYCIYQCIIFMDIFFDGALKGVGNSPSN